MKRGHVWTAGVALCCLVAGGAAQAQSWSGDGAYGSRTGWPPAHPYSLAVAASATHWRATCPQAVVCDRNDTGGRVTLGWAFMPGWTAEAFYVDEGQVHARQWLMPDNALQVSRLRVRGAGIGLAWWVPMDSAWRGVVRGGAVQHRVRFNEERDVGAGTIVQAEETHDHFDPTLGLGLSYRLNARWQLDARLDWTQTRLQPMSQPQPQAQSLINGGTVSAHQWSLGLTYGF